MTRQMADDEVLRVLGAAKAFAASAGEFEIASNTGRAYHSVAALQAERDALRDDNARLRMAHDVVDASARRVRERAERAESALEALRGQVAGVVEKWRAESDWTGVTGTFADELDALLAMKNSGEF